MNNNHSESALKYKNRLLAPRIESAVSRHPVVVLTGARQVGKSTLLTREKAFREWKYVTMDDYAALSLARREPISLWISEKRIIIDEVQKTPSILSSIKEAVDRDRSLRFLLSGSANLLLMEKVSESLSGRAVYFNLFPMSYSEMESRPFHSILGSLLAGTFSIESLRKKDHAEDPCVLMARGFMPALMEYGSPEGWLQWWEGYIATYLERDLRQLSQVDSLVEFRRVMEALSLRSGQLVNQTGIARDVGISQSSVYRYLTLLEVTCLLKRVPSFHRNRTSRLVKSPKYYFLDPALAAYLGGYFSADALRKSRELGGYFESLILLHILIQCDLMMPAARTFYWRTVSGREVDFVVEHGRSLLPIEVKYTSRPRIEDTAGLRHFMKEYPEAETGVLIHTGAEAEYLGEKIVAIPWTKMI
ncbi:MAG: ATP-binding protein [Candidatus Eremiobacteraeota bacterium]|nr:ATP-binding protein [Candidatus Eremiobacteraeota bacterium]